MVFKSDLTNIALDKIVSMINHGSSLVSYQLTALSCNGVKQTAAYKEVVYPSEPMVDAPIMNLDVGYLSIPFFMEMLEQALSETSETLPYDMFEHLIEDVQNTATEILDLDLLHEINWPDAPLSTTTPFLLQPEQLAVLPQALQLEQSNDVNIFNATVIAGGLEPQDQLKFDTDLLQHLNFVEIKDANNIIGYEFYGSAPAEIYENLLSSMIIVLDNYDYNPTARILSFQATNETGEDVNVIPNYVSLTTAHGIDAGESEITTMNLDDLIIQENNEFTALFDGIFTDPADSANLIDVSATPALEIHSQDAYGNPLVTFAGITPELTQEELVVS